MNYITRATSNFRGTQPFLGKVFLGISGLTAVLGAWSYVQSKTVESEIAFRKKQLAKPIYKLSQEEMINPPWNSSNLNEWLYRRVEVTGRPIHRLQCMIPRFVTGIDGFECVVPLVARENDDRTQREGILFSRGFIPYKFKEIPNRFKIEDVSKQTFVGFVSTLPELQSHGFFEGNAYEDSQRIHYSYANLDDMSKTANFKNHKQAKVAVVEHLYPIGDLNERRGKRYSHDCDGALDYPYCKTEAGALQLPKMPWDHKNDSKFYFVTSIASLIVGASIF